jgi:hypothetical protein
MGKSTVGRSNAKGLTLVALTGLIALLLIWRWPTARHWTLFALAMAWLLIHMLVMAARVPGAHSLSLKGLYRTVHESEYRTSLSAKLLALISIGLLIYSIAS